MPSAFDSMFASFAVPAMQSLHGETITHYPAGVVASAVSVDDVVFQETDATYDKSRGQDNSRTGSLLVPAAVTLLPSDRWLIRSVTWETESVGGKDPSGLTLVKIVRHEQTEARRHDTQLL